MIKERQTSLAPYLTGPGPGWKEAFPFLCAHHHPTIIKENCGLCRDQRSLHHYVCLIVQNAQWIDFLKDACVFSCEILEWWTLWRTSSFLWMPLPSCQPGFVLLLGSRKKHWPALSHCLQASSDSETPSRSALAAHASWQTASTVESEQEVVRTSCCPQRQETPYVIYFFHLRPPSIILEPSNNLLEIRIYPWVKAFIRPQPPSSVLLWKHPTQGCITDPRLLLNPFNSIIKMQHQTEFQ